MEIYTEVIASILFVFLQIGFELISWIGFALVMTVVLSGISLIIILPILHLANFVFRNSEQGELISLTNSFEKITRSIAIFSFIISLPFIFFGVEKTLNEIYAKVNELNNKDKSTIESAKEEVARFKLTKITKPKHVYVDLVGVESNKVFKNIHVAKYCKNINENSIGEEFNIQIHKYYHKETEQFIQFKRENLIKAFC